MVQGLRTPTSLELLNWAFPSGLTITRQCGMDRRCKRDRLLRAVERARFANPESAAPRPLRETVPRCCGASRDPRSPHALVIEAGWRKRAPGRGSGAAESAARRATPASLAILAKCSPDPQIIGNQRGEEMPTYNLIITDVTCYGDLFCVAGWDLDNGGMIRPEPPTANAIAEASRFWGGQHAGPGKFFSVGNVVRFDAALPPVNFPFPHATEDRLVVVGNSALIGQMTATQIVQTVAPGVSISMNMAFGGQLNRANSGKAHVIAGTQTCSLDAINIAPASLSFYEDNPSPGKRRLRALIDQNGVEYDFSVPADAARSRFLAGGVAALEADAAASQSVHVRLGLCRPFAAMPNSCYAQVNGLYFL